MPVNITMPERLASEAPGLQGEETANAFYGDFAALSSDMLIALRT